MRTPRSAPETVAVTSSSPSSMLTVPGTPSAASDRSSSARATAASSSSSSAIGSGVPARPLRRSHDARRRVADAEQAPLALGQDLEAHGLAVDAGREPLELAERRPLRLADGLARRLDGDLVAHRRLPPPLRFRFTRRGGPATDGRAPSGVGAAVLALR